MSPERSWRGRVKDTWWGSSSPHLETDISVLARHVCWSLSASFAPHRCSNSRGPAWWGRCTGTSRGLRPPTSRSSLDTTSQETVRDQICSDNTLLVSWKLWEYDFFFSFLIIYFFLLTIFIEYLKKKEMYSVFTP